jgi:MOSC domain-containing protein YiiM
MSPSPSEAFSFTGPVATKKLTGTIRSVQVGSVAPLGPQGVLSGFVKRPIEGQVAVTRGGLTGDAQADLTVHGGRDKAIYLYPAEHYDAWRAEMPQHQTALQPGGFGENLTTGGLDERNVCIGDVVRAGSAVLQVTQFRQPCFKLSLRFDDNRLPKAVLKSGRSGWYARVLEDGFLQRDAPILLQERPNPTWTVARLLTLFVNHSATLDELIELAKLPGLARHWQRTVRSNLEDIAREQQRRDASQRVAPAESGGQS